MRYDEWCSRLGFGARLPGDTSPTPLEAAEAKRERKAVKRRRDAERMEEARLFGTKAERARWARNMAEAIRRGDADDDEVTP